MNQVLAAEDGSILFSDFDQVGNSTPLFDAAHLREVRALCPKVLFNFLASQPRLEIFWSTPGELIRTRLRASFWPLI
jgi:hypothetical protein